MNIKKNIVILGGRFAYLKFIQNPDMTDFNVFLLDKKTPSFQLLFYQVGPAQLDLTNISFPFIKAFCTK